MFALFAFSMSLLAAEPLPSQPLWIRLGPANEEHGLASPSGGDGATAAETMAGSHCRRIRGGNSHYMYFKADGSLAPPGDYNAYLTVEYFDDCIEVARVEYDKAPLDRDKNSFYTLAEDLILLTGSGQWRWAVVHLPQARFGHGQNFAADFRLMGRDLAVRRVDLSFTRPSDYRAGGIDAEELKKFAASIGRGMELDIGDDTDRGESVLFGVLGATSVESYVTWQFAELLDHPRGRIGWPGLRAGLRVRAGRGRDGRRQRSPDLQRHGLRRRPPLLLQGQHPAKRPEPGDIPAQYRLPRAADAGSPRGPLSPQDRVGVGR